MFILPGALAPLAAYAQFILVKYVQKLSPLGVPVAGKTVKFPVDHRTLEVSDAHNPAIWLSVAEATRIANTTPVPADALAWGVGFVITAADPFACLDMDECLIDGAWSPAALAMLAEFPGACEVSNSGRGLHSWVTYTGTPPEHGKKAQGWLELYTEARFMALGSAASGQMIDATALLPAFIAKYFPPSELDVAADWSDGPVPEYTHISDDAILDRALRQQRQQSPAAVFEGLPVLPDFADLWNRNVDVLSRAYPSTTGDQFGGSEADFALAKELAYWTGKDCERIERMMRMSALARDKWDTRRKDTTYLRLSITKAVAACQQVYHLKPVLSEAAAGRKLVPTVIESNDVMVGREKMADVFADCAYIQDSNAIIVPNGDIVDQPRFKSRFGGKIFAMDNNNDKTTKDAWDAFLNNSILRFPRVDGTVFEPTMDFQEVLDRAGRTWINVYKAPVVDRRPGDCAPFLELLNKLLPNGDDAIILLSYLAAVVQYVGVKFRWAPFIQGTPGNGKSTIVSCLKYALGEKYIFSVKAGMIENNFNAWLENNILYVADDIYSSKDRTDMMECLKALITETDHGITYKGIDSMQKRIVGNFIFTDNHKDAMQKRDDSRRICTLYCAQQSKYDRRRDGLTKEYFTRKLIPWLKAGGYAHVAELLATMPIDPRYNPADECQEAPDTSVTQEAVVDGRTGIEHEVAEWIELEVPGFCGGFVSHHILRARMVETPQFARSASPLKIKEMLGRLGYEMHRALPGGRTTIEVAPDRTRPILYVHRDNPAANVTDPGVIAAIYQNAQQAAQAALIQRQFNQGG